MKSETAEAYSRWQGSLVGRYVGTDGQERSKTLELEKHAKAWSVERERSQARRVG